jgi:hypothetical protein
MLEVILLTVVLLFVYIAYNRFESSVDSLVSVAELKATDIELSSKYKNAKFRSKLATKIDTLDSIPSVSILNKLLDGE